MRKRNKGRILSRPKSQRVALLNTMATSLFLHEKIEVTHAKAKELRSFAEKCITRAKDNSVANRRLLTASLSPATVKKLVDKIAPLYASRNGGYTRIIKTGPRKSDSAQLAVIELVK